MADAFNNYFVEVVTQLQDKIQPQTNKLIELTNDKSIYLKPCTDRELKEVVFSCKKTYSSGYDNINIIDIQILFGTIKDKLLKCINEILKSGEFPKSCKITRVIPLFKKGSKNMPGNYRPISVGTIFAKIIEKILKNRFIQFFNISNSQYGFQKESSTIGAACDLIEEVIKKWKQATT